MLILETQILKPAHVPGGSNSQSPDCPENNNNSNNDEMKEQEHLLKPWGESHFRGAGSSPACAFDGNSNGHRCHHPGSQSNRDFEGTCTFRSGEGSSSSNPCCCWCGEEWPLGAGRAGGTVSAWLGPQPSLGSSHLLPRPCSIQGHAQGLWKHWHCSESNGALKVLQSKRCVLSPWDYLQWASRQTSISADDIPNSLMALSLVLLPKPLGSPWAGCQSGEEEEEKEEELLWGQQCCPLTRAAPSIPESSRNCQRTPSNPERYKALPSLNVKPFYRVH